MSKQIKNTDLQRLVNVIEQVKDSVTDFERQNVQARCGSDPITVLTATQRYVYQLDILKSEFINLVNSYLKGRQQIWQQWRQANLLEMQVKQLHEIVHYGVIVRNTEILVQWGLFYQAYISPSLQRDLINRLRQDKQALINEAIQEGYSEDADLYNQYYETLISSLN